MDNKQEFIKALGLSPEIVDAISHTQAAADSLSRLPENLRSQDPDMADDWTPAIDDIMTDFSAIRASLYRLMAEIAACRQA